MGLGIASVFIVGGSIVPAFADAASRNIPIPNVEYTTEDWYVKENAHLIKNKDVSDLRNIVEFTVDTSQGIDKDTGRVWDGGKVADDNYAISKGRENSVCVVKNKDVKYRDKDVFKRVYLNELGLQDKVEFSDDWYMKEILYACAVPNTEVELTEVYVGGKKANAAPIKLKVNEDCSLSPVDDTTKVEGDVVNISLGKKPANSDKPVVGPSDNNKPSDKPNTDKPNADKPVVDNNKPADKVDGKTPADKVDSVKPVVDNKANQNVNNVAKRPAVANADTPKTSDNSNIALYSMLLIGSIGAISVVSRRKLRTNK